VQFTLYLHTKQLKPIVVDVELPRQTVSPCMYVTFTTSIIEQLNLITSNMAVRILTVASFNCKKIIVKIVVFRAFNSYLLWDQVLASRSLF
jgi:hypothetical protein